MLEDWVKKEGVSVLNVAGRCASKDPQIYDITFAIIGKYLKKAGGN